MSKFKVGDKIRAVRDSFGGSYSKGDEFTFKGYSGGGKVKLVGALFDGLHFEVDHFELADVDERQKLSDAIDLLAKHKVIITGSQMTYEDSPSFTYTGLGSGLGTWTTKENFLERLFPTETPAQKKLKELEQQQLGIVAKMEELRKSM